MTVLSYFEKKYACSGVCTAALFYYSLPLEQGPPNQVCLMFLKNEIGSSLIYLGSVSIAGGVVMALIWCF